MFMREEVITKVTQHVAERFGDDWARLGKHYDWSQDEKLDATEITILLRAAGVGRMIAPLAARAIVQELDTDGDGAVSLAELERVFKPE